MVKTTVSVTLDYEVWLEAKARHENLSKHINDLLLSEKPQDEEEQDPKVLKEMLKAKDKLLQILQEREQERIEKQKSEDNIIKRFET